MHFFLCPAFALTSSLCICIERKKTRIEREKFKHFFQYLKNKQIDCKICFLTKISRTLECEFIIKEV